VVIITFDFIGEF